MFVGVIYVVAFFLLDLGAFTHENRLGAGISLWYAPVGLTLAFLLRFGLGYAPLYLLISVVDNYVVWRQQAQLSSFIPALIAVVPCSIYPFCVWVLRTRFRIDIHMRDLRSAAIFVIAIGVSGVFVSMGYVAILYTQGRVLSGVWHSALDFWIGDVVAILSITPFLLTIVFPFGEAILRTASRPQAAMHALRSLRKFAPVAFSTILWLAVLLPTIAFCISETERSNRAILYPCLVPLVFAAYWRGMRGAAAGIVLVSASIAFFVDSSVKHMGVHEIQLFLITLCLTTLLLGAAITSVTSTQRNLQQVHDVYRQAITAANAVPYVLDYESGRYLYLGERIDDITGFTAQEFTPSVWDERCNVLTLHGEAKGIAPEDAIRRTRKGEFEAWSSEGTFLAKDGSTRWVADASVELLGADGIPTRSIGLIQDISRLKETEEALRNSQTVLYLFVEHTPAAVAMLDREMRYLVASKRWMQDYRLGDQDIVGKSHYDVFPEIPQRWREIHRRCLAGAVEKCDEERFVRADGSDDWIRWEVHPWYEKSGAIGGVIIFSEVITARKKAEEAIRKGEERLELALGGADLGLWDLEIEAARLSVNPRFAEIFGFTMDTVPNDSDFWYGRIHPDDATKVVDHTWSHIERERTNLDLDFRMLTKTDQLIWVQLRGKIVDRSEGGVPLRITGTLQDITAQKLAEEERRKIEEQMQQTQKLESLGILAGGIAHDFNNLLVGILGNADLALSDAPPHSALRNSLDAIVTSSERAAELCRQMLAYSGRGRFVVVPVSLNEMVKEMGQLLTVTMSKRVTLQFDPEPELPLVKADATQIRQIVLNLITNASEAIGDREGTIRMATGMLVWRGEQEGFQITGGELRESQQYAFVRVSDTGSGMDAATLQRIFDPFFTTKFTGRGLGLAAVLGIVRGHRGAIRVESEVGKGTTFTVYLPALDKDAETAPAPERPSPSIKGEGVVLVVDDEEAVLGIARSMLERLGFEALSATDGEEALRLFQKRKDAIVLAIVDLTMPRMGGAELIRALHEIKPDLRVVLSSGYNEQEAVAQSHGEATAGFIQKPYRTRDFHRAIQAALNGGPRGGYG
jgi:PAS domain S-box-containing protein